MHYSVLETQLLNFDFEAFPSSSSTNLLASKDILQSHISNQNVDEFHEESRVSQVESIDISMFLGTQKEAVLPSASFNESRQIGIEHNMAMESLRSLCEMDQENVCVDEPLAFQENENFHYNQSSVVKESVGELIEESIVDPTPQSKFQGNLEVQKKVSFEHGQSSVNPAESTIVDPTPQSKFQGSSIGRPKPGL